MVVTQTADPPYDLNCVGVTVINRDDAEAGEEVGDEAGGEVAVDLVFVFGEDRGDEGSSTFSYCCEEEERDVDLCFCRGW